MSNPHRYSWRRVFVNDTFLRDRECGAQDSSVDVAWQCDATLRAPSFGQNERPAAHPCAAGRVANLDMESSYPSLRFAGRFPFSFGFGTSSIKPRSCSSFSSVERDGQRLDDDVIISHLECGAELQSPADAGGL